MPSHPIMVMKIKFLISYAATSFTCGCGSNDPGVTPTPVLHVTRIGKGASPNFSQVSNIAISMKLIFQYELLYSIVHKKRNIRSTWVPSIKTRNYTRPEWILCQSRTPPTTRPSLGPVNWVVV